MIKFVIHRFETCSSTNDVAREMALRGAPEGTVVVAEEQTAGRGTKGRSWHSPKGKGLYVSVVLRPSAAALSLLPVAAGLAARGAVERTHGLSARLRWPNDIVWEGKKLGGILCESGFLGNRLEYAILGVGLNVGHDVDDFPEDLRGPALSIRMTGRKVVDGEGLLRQLLSEIGRWREIFSEIGGEDRIVEAFERYSVFHKGDAVTVIEDGKPFRGIYQGIGRGGALLVLIKNENRRFTSADSIKISKPGSVKAFCGTGGAERAPQRSKRRGPPEGG